MGGRLRTFVVLVTIILVVKFIEGLTLFKKRQRWLSLGKCCCCWDAGNVWDHFQTFGSRCVLLLLRLTKWIKMNVREHNSKTGTTANNTPLYLNYTQCFWSTFWLHESRCLRCCGPSQIHLQRASIPKLSSSNYHRNDKSSPKSPVALFFLSSDSPERTEWMLEWFARRSRPDRACEAAVFKGNRSWSLGN